MNHNTPRALAFYSINLSLIKIANFVMLQEIRHVSPQTSTFNLLKKKFYFLYFHNFIQLLQGLMLQPHLRLNMKIETAQKSCRETYKTYINHNKPSHLIVYCALIHDIHDLYRQKHCPSACILTFDLVR